MRRAVGKLSRPVASSSDDPGYAARLACALGAAGRRREAERWRVRAAARYDELASRHPEAFAGHAADFRRHSGRLLSHNLISQASCGLYRDVFMADRGEMVLF